ncbi:sensor histidine kinase [Roseivivax sp. CAU 1761]
MPESIPNSDLNELFQHSPACLALVEAAEPFRCIAHNPAFQAVLDEPFRSTGVVGRPLSDFAPQSGELLAVYRHVAATGEPFAMEGFRYDGLERGTTWWNWSLTPVRRDDRIVSLVATAVEITDAVEARRRLEGEIEARRRTEAELETEKALFQRIVDIIPVMITMYDTSKTVLMVNEAFARLTGWDTELAQHEPVMELAFPDPAYRDEIAAFMDRCDGWMDIAMRTRDGRSIPTSWSNVRLSDGRQIGIGIDLSDRKAAERALTESRRELAMERAFLEAVIETAPVGISVARDPQGKPPIVNGEARRMMEITGLEGGLERYDALPGRDLDGRPFAHSELAIVKAIEEGQEISDREVLFRSSTGDRRWLVNARPLRDHEDRVLAAIASFVDIEDMRRAEEARQLLVEELNHRVKNTLAVVQSIAVQSFRDLSDPNLAQTKFQSRLRGLAAAHDLLTRENWSNAMLSDILTTSLEACGESVGELGRVSLLLDTDERLMPKLAVSMSMALHELITNAIKYGALSATEGRVRITCATRPDRPELIRIGWYERGGPPPVWTDRQGFGMRLLRTTVEREMSGQLGLEFASDGLACEIDLPRAALAGQPQPVPTGAG